MGRITRTKGSKGIRREGESMERMQIMLEPPQKEALDEIARSQNISRSLLLRRIVDEAIRDHKRKKMEEAARELLHDYETNPELTIFNSLDGEDFDAQG